MLKFFLIKFFILYIICIKVLQLWGVFMDKETKKSFPIKLIAILLSVLICMLAVLLVSLSFSEDNGIFTNILSILSPFVYGAVFAYILRPICNRLEPFFCKHFRNKLKKLASPLSIAISFIILIIVIYLFIIAILPNLVSSIVALVNNIEQGYNSIIEWLNNTFENNEVILNYALDIVESISLQLGDWLTNSLLPNLTSMLNGFAGGVASVVLTVKDIIVGFFVAVYLLNSRKKFAAQGNIVLHSIFKKERADHILTEVRYADKVFEGFLVGTVIDAFIVGVLTYIFSLIFGFPNALLIGVIIAITNVIPFFGPFIGAIPSALLIFIQSPIKALWFCIFILVLQQLDGNFLHPKIVGNTTGLSSFWVLFAIILFGGLMGFFGLIIGVPLFAVIYDIIRKLILRGLKRRECMHMLDDYHEKFCK